MWALRNKEGLTDYQGFFFCDSRRLVEKEERLEATINSLKAQHGEETSAEAIAELQELILPAEREQLKKLKLNLAK